MYGTLVGVETLVPAAGSKFALARVLAGDSVDTKRFSSAFMSYMLPRSPNTTTHCYHLDVAGRYSFLLCP